MKPGPTAYLSALAALITLAVAWGLARAGAGVENGGPGVGLWLVLAVPAPVVVAVVWGWAIVAETRWLRLVAAVAAWLASGHVLVSAADTWQMTANVAAGLVAGAAWRRGWRPDVALLGTAAMLAPLVIWAAVQMPVREQMAAIGEQSLQVLEQQAPPGTDPAELAKAREIGRQRMATLTDLATRLYPSLIGVGLLGQAVLLLVLVRLGGRRLAVAVTGRRLPPFAQWRLPFYLVWVLVAGIGLMLTRRAPWADAGLNLAVLAAAFLGVQGLAVQYHLSRRFLPPVMLVVYWALMGLAFVPLVATSVLLGLLDQWRDLRGPVSGGKDSGGKGAGNQ
ncbi:MAG: DUF2232 domain-containing protein [bacterium]|nr:DUF2232 domain-containing protein [bacterium]